MNNVTVTLPSGKKKAYPYGTRVKDILKDKEFQDPPYPIVGALVDYNLTSITYKVEINCTVKPVLLNSDQGAGIYRRSLSFLVSMVAKKVFPERRLIIGHSLGDGYYFYFDDSTGASSEDIQLLKEEMGRLVESDIPIQRKVISYQEALDHFEKSRHIDTALLLKHRNESRIPTYQCNDFLDIAHGPLVPSTGTLSTYEIIEYPPGFLLRYPEKQSPYHVKPFEDNPVLFSVYQEYKAWGKILNLNSAGKLNEISRTPKLREFIRVAEALHNKKIAEIADKILTRKGTLGVVLIAGPSSSGKTTFTKKLAIQLRVIGFNPVVISLDDYFVTRNLTPRDENGDYDFENIKAIDVDLLNKHLMALFQGEEVYIPSFDFITGTRIGEGKPLKMGNRSILLLEGIHGLNPSLTPQVPEEKKYKIYVSALTQLNLDDQNRIPTTDNRLLRRMVRDYNFRGHTALNTLSMWASVRRGEKKNIFPFQNNADSAFNSALDYELAVLQVYAEPLLKSVKPYNKEYTEAVRLMDFLNNFNPIPAKYVPDDSILREFIGDSWFKY